MPVEHRQGLVDTNIVILRRWIRPEDLPAEVAITSITLAELSAGPHEVRRNEEQDEYDEYAQRARRTDVLQRTENEFDPVPFARRHCTTGSSAADEKTPPHAAAPRHTPPHTDARRRTRINANRCANNVACGRLTAWNNASV